MESSDLKVDVILIGAGIMSATLGVLLKELNPDLEIIILERLNGVALESSNAMNNAGTGHSAYCELNYTPIKADGTVSLDKATKVASWFQESKEFWSYLVDNKIIGKPEKFISSVPHHSLVWGNENVSFLKKRYEAMRLLPHFQGMMYSEDPAEIEKWMPLVFKDRKPGEKVAATRMEAGTDVNFGELTRQLVKSLTAQKGVGLLLETEVEDIKEVSEGRWQIEVENRNGSTSHFEAPFVFVGAGGGALRILEKSDIKEAEGYGGFPVSGQWLVCKNEEIIKQHQAKVYGLASVGSPPMSVPHLDTRMIDGKRSLLFGPFAGFSTKFLKNGSYWDLFSTIELDNIYPLLSAGFHNYELTKYLIKQVSLSLEDKMDALREFVPSAKTEDWELKIAGQRVQVIKRDDKDGGVLEFGTEIVSHEDGSIAALLGASPGASTAVHVMLDLMQTCFKEKMNQHEWKEKLKCMIPSYIDKSNEVDVVLKRKTRVSQSLSLVN